MSPAAARQDAQPLGHGHQAEDAAQARARYLRESGAALVAALIGSAPRLLKGVEVYCEGRLSLRPWTDASGEKRAGLSLATGLVQVMGQIGRARQ
jgi:hypothetical protein